MFDYRHTAPLLTAQGNDSGAFLIFVFCSLTLSFFPQFVEPGTNQPLFQLLLLSAAFMLMTFVVFVAYGLIAHGFRRLVVDSDRVQSWLRFGFATAFVGLGAKLALSEK